VPDLPPRPDLDQLRRQAKDLLRAARAGDPEAAARIAAVSDRLGLSAAQHAIARQYLFTGWPRLATEVHRRTLIDRADRDRLAALLTDDPGLATTVMQHWCDHPRGAAPLNYVAMMRYDTARRLWRDVPGTGPLAEALLAAGAPVDGSPSERETPLITAASYGDPDVALVLVRAGADLRARAAQDAGGVPGGTPVTHAAVFGMTAVLDLLVAAGAPVDDVVMAAAAGDVTGHLTARTPAEDTILALIMAADHQRIDVIDLLLAAGVRVDATDPTWGRHPLRLAAANGRGRSVAHLLSRGADPRLRDRQGRTPLQLCRIGRGQHADPTRHDEVEEILVAAGG
jgi:hypothetical protein